MQNEINDFSFRFKITFVRIILLLILLAALGVIAVRFIFGLHTVTNLNDNWPWGLWIGFDVMCGVALAGGGYGTALLVHVLHIERLRPIARGAMLTSLIGYLLVMAGLFLDIGRWWNFWRPFISWGHDSILFEVFWCISAYTIVQVLEFCEILTERIFRKLHKIFVTILPALMIIGVAIPTMHQASLGGLYLLMDGRLHPLWWSPIIFVFFLLSSFFVGPAMIMIESAISSKTLNHKVPIDVLKSLAKIGGVAMLIYLILRMTDLILRDKIGLILGNEYESLAFRLEIVIGLIVPIMIVFSPLSGSRFWLVVYGICASFGVFLNRMNVVVTGMIREMGGFYYPSIYEIIVSFGLVSAGILVYLFVCENFKIVDPNAHRKEALPKIAPV
ncbi:MAG: Ni/Fe-hydrogenase cytochrome b subunit [Planctomycetaceae bacterium]|jgi:Ni/Fe-hydrogenase subunit HybB-like protein|nr:Ni/Fe-hydrogenase cytochrome b subunit [Planctomycetaceae bacterium]